MNPAELTAEESSALADLTRSDRVWPLSRWLLLAAGVLLIATSIFVDRDAAELVAKVSSGDAGARASEVLPLVARSSVLSWVARVAGLLLIVHVAAEWRGNALRKLVLRVYSGN